MEMAVLGVVTAATIKGEFFAELPYVISNLPDDIIFA